MNIFLTIAAGLGIVIVVGLLMVAAAAFYGRRQDGRERTAYVETVTAEMKRIKDTRPGGTR